jgi:hypothetical protein
MIAFALSSTTAVLAAGHKYKRASPSVHAPGKSRIYQACIAEQLQIGVMEGLPRSPHCIKAPWKPITYGQEESTGRGGKNGEIEWRL